MATYELKVLDSANLYVENTDLSTAVLTVTATSTATKNGADQTNLLHTGGLFYVVFTSVVATSTVRVNVQGKDPISGNYITVASVSIDAVSVTTNGNASQAIYVYAGAVGGNANVFGVPLPRTYRVQASITVINATATSAVTMTIGQSKIL